MEQVLGSVLLQLAKEQQILLHGRFSVATRAVRFSVATRAVGAYAAAASRCRTNATMKVRARIFVDVVAVHRIQF